MKLVTVFFDLEAPFLWREEGKFDLEETVRNIFEVLGHFGVKAVFNTCGIVADKFPKSIVMLHDEGHEIGSHGYAHENFLKIPAAELDDVLAKTERVMQRVVGEKPLGVRSPWLARNEDIYGVFRKRGYGWVSNLDLHFRGPMSRPNVGAVSYSKRVVGKTLYRLRRLSQSGEPYRRATLVEIPLLSPMDVYSIHPFPPAGPSPTGILEEAYQVLVEHYKWSKTYFNLNFHEHVIGTDNRIQLLERIIRYLSEQPDARFVLPRQIVSSFL
jgi:peptidoglycan/xylan/chitin deacetylase (PgdA/CDA1 family)